MQRVGPNGESLRREASLDVRATLPGHAARQEAGLAWMRRARPRLERGDQTHVRRGGVLTRTGGVGVACRTDPGLPGFSRIRRESATSMWEGVGT